MEFSRFETANTDACAARAKIAWGGTEAYEEFEKKSAGRSEEERCRLGEQLMDIFSEFGKIKTLAPESREAAALVRKLQDDITDNYYTCTDEILYSLGRIYAAGNEFTENIDRAGGESTAAFVYKAIVAAAGKNR